MESIRLAVGLFEPFVDLDDLGRQDGGGAGGGQIECAGICRFEGNDGDLLVVDRCWLEPAGDPGSESGAARACATGGAFAVLACCGATFGSRVTWLAATRSPRVGPG